MNNFVIYTDAEGKEQARAMTPEEQDEFEKRNERRKEIIRKYHGDFDSYQITGKEGYVARIRAGKYMQEPIAEEALAEIEKMETLPAVREETALIQETGQNVRELLAGMRAMGEMMRVMNERMTAMEQTIRTLEKVTPGQAAEVNRKIRERAGQICEEYGIGQEGDTLGWEEPGENGEPVEVEYKQLPFKPDPERLKELTGAIRKDVREMTGVKTAREIARCDYPAVKEFVESWEDYDVIRGIREKEMEAAWKK